MWHEMRTLGPGAPRRPRAAGAGRDRQRAGVLVRHRHDGVHVAPGRLDRVGRRRRHPPRRPDRRRHPPRAGLVLVAVDGAVPDDRGGAGLRVRRRASSSRSRATSACSRAARRSACSSTSTGSSPTSAARNGCPRVVGANKAKELIWTAARIDADEAYRIGLCERLVDDADLETDVTALAATIAAQPPLAVQGAKRAVAGVGPPADRRGTGLRSRAAEGVPRVRRHARGDHRGRRVARTRLPREVTR